MNTNTKEYIQTLLYNHMNSIPLEDRDYLIFIQNKIIRLGVQPLNANGYRTKYKFIPTGPIHISVKPKLWKRYQSFLVSEYRFGNHPLNVQYGLDALINQSYKRIGKLYEKVNKHYDSIREYKNSINNQ